MVSDHALSGPISLWKVQIFICRPPCMQIPLDADSSLDADPPSPSRGQNDTLL